MNTLRPAQPADCARIARLHSTCLPQAWDEAVFSGWLNDPLYHMWVAGEDSLHGYAVARIVAGEGELIALAVDPSYRRCGIAKALLRHLQNTAHLTACFLEVSVGNAAARHLYLSQGFVETGLRARYYADGSDALQMRWQKR